MINQQQQDTPKTSSRFVRGAKFAFGGGPKKIIGTERVVSHARYLGSIAQKLFLKSDRGPEIHNFAELEFHYPAIADFKFVTERYTAFRRTFFVCAALLVVAVAWMARSIVIDQLSNVIVLPVMISILIANGLSYAYRAYEMRTRQIISFRKFMSLGSEIIPASWPGKGETESHWRSQDARNFMVVKEDSSRTVLSKQ